MNKLLSKTFLWMFIGLMVTFVTGYIVSINENMLEAIFGGYLFYILIILEFIIVIFFSTRVSKMKPTAAGVSFILYAFVSGLTFSSIFVLFNISTVMYVFLITAILFAIFGLIGYFTNIDLSKIGTILIMALFGVIICVIVNMFLGNETLDLIVSIIALLIFFGFTAYDIQNVKKLANSGFEEIAAINGAFELYLDFINIFIHLLQIMKDAD